MHIHILTHICMIKYGYTQQICLTFTHIRSTRPHTHTHTHTLSLSHTHTYIKQSAASDFEWAEGLFVKERGLIDVKGKGAMRTYWLTGSSVGGITVSSLHTPTRSNTLQHTPTRSNTLQHTLTHSNTLQHTPTHSNTL